MFLRPVHPERVSVRVVVHDDGHRGGQVPGHLHPATRQGRVQGWILEVVPHLDSVHLPLDPLGRLSLGQTDIYLHNPSPMSAGSLDKLPGLGVADNVPDPVPDPVVGHHVGLLHDLLPPVGGGTHWRRHPSTTTPETGKQAENHQDAGLGGHPLWSLLASSELVPSHLRLEQVRTRTN